MSAPYRRHDTLAPYCWACGAVDGDYEDFVGRYVRLCLCEPHDDNFPLDLGVQWFCSVCLVGRHMMRFPSLRPVRGWFAGARTPRWHLVAWTRLNGSG